jgi:multiple sugar transport system substrate-binding protein
MKHMSVQLKGITWDHSRGYVPMVATSQLYSEMYPGIEIVWEKRSLQEFADYSIEKLMERYDLLVIDHPWAGFAARKKLLVPFNEHLPKAYLDDQAANSVGKSHLSYNFDGYQTALAIDAATPVASYRPDLLERHQLSLPQKWEDLIDLAKKGWVALPAISVDTVMNFYMLCVSQGEEPFVQDDQIISPEMGIRVLDQLRELTQLCTPEVFDWNPIKVYQAMSGRNDLAYCPFAYGYSNYSRPGYAKHMLQFCDMISIGDNDRLSSTLGGTGLAISVNCKHLDAALDYAKFAASPECQRTVYVENGGQSGHRNAWVDEKVNAACGNFFKETLPALDRAYLRPRYFGYMHVQDNSGEYLVEYVRNGGDPKRVLEQLNRLYRESKALVPESI